MTVISYFSILRAIKLFKTGMTFFCCFMLSFQQVSPVTGCCGNFSYSHFVSSSMCATKVFPTVHFYWIKIIYIYKRAVYTQLRWYMYVYLFCIWSLTFSLFSFDSSSLHTYHLMDSICFQNSASKILRIAWMEPWTNSEHHEISQMVSWLQCDHYCCSTHSACHGAIQTVHAKVTCSFMGCI